MKIIFSKNAKQELNDATRFYELEVQSLGKRFREEVRKAVLRACKSNCVNALLSKN